MPAAVEAVQQLVRSAVTEVCRRTCPGVDADELAGALVEKMLVGASRTLGQYQGRGSLEGWIAVCATRMAVRRAVQTKHHVELDDVFELGADGVEPELQHLKNVHRADVSAAFREALEALGVRERNLLRQHYLDGLTLNELGALYGVHRLTALRWLDAARLTLLQHATDRLSSRLGLQRLEANSLIRALRSQLDVSLTVLLGTRG
jgi:RNA polymerase sigma-70 factor (ECF subfamily)